MFSPVELETICPKCVAKDEEAYMTVRSHVADHPGATIAEIHEATQVPVDVIDRLYKAGRFSEAAMAKCSRCGKDNANGLQVCNECADTMRNDFNSAMSELKTPQRPQQTVSMRREIGKYGLGRRD